MRHTERSRTGTNRSHQRWMLERMCELIQPVKPGIAVGELSREAYEGVVRELKTGGQIQSAPAFEEFYVTRRP